jgi:flagellar biosynthesis/type III secretory pathway protein FliH
MTNNKQQTAVEWLRQEVLKQDIDSSSRELYKQAKEMEIAGKEMSYADGYAEGYHRAIENAKYQINKWIDKELKITQ